jgi:hypothetical protein
MEIGATTGAGLMEVDCNRPVVSHNAEESNLLVPSSAPNASAYRSGHRNRLTLPRMRSIPRRVAGSQVSVFAASDDTFAPSRVGLQKPSKKVC